jgi:hypothetical protein
VGSCSQEVRGAMRRQDAGMTPAAEPELDLRNLDYICHSDSDCMSDCRRLAHPIIHFALDSS